MKSEKKRGRPRAFDESKTVERARAVFWDRGFAAASLDMLSAATELNRPSLYAAFGDKEDLYLATLEAYRRESLEALAVALDASLSIRQNIERVYASALLTYLHGDTSSRGCFLIGTATAEAVEHPRVREVLGRSLREFDAAIEQRIGMAVKTGELAAGSDAKTLAALVSAVMHSLAVRARAGDGSESLEMLARSGVDWICGKA
jgi:AcrR family transcriptional regulator